jgi:hypothetical protein
MPANMKPHQLSFWRELFAPFDDSQLSKTKRGGKELTYIDKRSITNRLDSVCGPHGWFPEYEATQRGYKCRLSILVPMDTEGTSVWMAKEDGAGFEEMGTTNKTTGEFEYDVDNDEKSGYTNALRRAAQDAWGIGRYLYGKGIPTFLDPNASATPMLDAVRGVAASERAATSPAPAPEPAPTPPAQAAPVYDNFKIPKPGRSVFAWTKEMEKTFETSLVAGMGREGENKGWGNKFAEWTEDQVTEIVMGAITHIRDLPTYKGQFEHFFPGGAPVQRPTADAAKPGVNLADLRKELATKISGLISKHTGATASMDQLRSSLNTISASTTNASGHAGEVCESLSKCTDQAWIEAMLVYVDKKIAETVQHPAAEDEGDAEIPF